MLKYLLYVAPFILFHLWQHGSWLPFFPRPVLTAGNLSCLRYDDNQQLRKRVDSVCSSEGPLKCAFSLRQQLALCNLPCQLEPYDILSPLQIGHAEIRGHIIIPWFSREDGLSWSPDQARRSATPIQVRCDRFHFTVSSLLNSEKPLSTHYSCLIRFGSRLGFPCIKASSRYLGFAVLRPRKGGSLFAGWETWGVFHKFLWGVEASRHLVRLLRLHPKSCNVRQAPKSRRARHRRPPWR